MNFLIKNWKKIWKLIAALQDASYQGLRDRLINLQITLRQKTNIDPLRGTGFETNPLFSPAHCPHNGWFWQDFVCRNESTQTTPWIQQELFFKEQKKYILNGTCKSNTCTLKVN